MEVFNRANPRFKVGQFHKNKKYGFVIQLVDKGDWSNRWIFKVIKGEIPPNLKPERYVTFKYKDEIYQYSRDAIYANFELISGKGAEVLFAPSRDKTNTQE